MDIITPNGLGKVVQGHVLDVCKKTLTRMLQDYDNQLYLKWNPNKNQGNGLWEIRRLPNTKMPVYKTTYYGQDIYNLEYVDNEVICHVLDTPNLHYGLVSRIKEMDAWQYENFGKFFEEKTEELTEKERTRQKEEFRYNLRHHKKYLAEFKEFVRAGYNPAYFFAPNKSGK